MTEDWFMRASAIPGQLEPLEMRKIYELAQKVPENGIIVETGSLYGRSSYIWAKGASPSVTVYCFDPWDRAQWIIDLVEEPFGAPTFGIEAFKDFTRDCPNIVAVPGYSPDSAASWTNPIDLYFEDAVHEGPIFEANCDFWLSHLKPGGIFCGHDFRAHPSYQDIIRRVISTAETWGASFEVTNSLFCVQKPY
jgi:hypothetical protein